MMKGETCQKKEVFEKYVDKKSHLSDTEKKEVMYVSYKYKEVYSLRDKIGTC